MLSCRAEDFDKNTLKDAAGSCLGGLSFAAGTKVLLANGKAVPISQLKPGEKVLATSTRTGQTRAETIGAVWVHRDTNLYDLTITAGGRTAVIGTTTNRWVKAAALRYGTHLRTPTGGYATVSGRLGPKDTTGWMWDLTIPGDHDFYIDTVAAPVLVHNCAALRRYQGGVYTLRDELENVVRTGRSGNYMNDNWNMLVILYSASSHSGLSI